MKEADRVLLWITLPLIGLAIFVILAGIAGNIWYAHDDFTATVTNIRYYGVGSVTGQNRVEVSFDDGRVLSLYDIPDELKEGQTYSLSYHKPYFLATPKLVIEGQP